jgi:hypothetical protein
VTRAKMRRRQNFLTHICGTTIRICIRSIRNGIRTHGEDPITRVDGEMRNSTEEFGFLGSRPLVRSRVCSHTMNCRCIADEFAKSPDKMRPGELGWIIT